MHVPCDVYKCRLDLGLQLDILKMHKYNYILTLCNIMYLYYIYPKIILTKTKKALIILLHFPLFLAMHIY